MLIKGSWRSKLDVVTLIDTKEYYVNLTIYSIDLDNVEFGFILAPHQIREIIRIMDEAEVKGYRPVEPTEFENQRFT